MSFAATLASRDVAYAVSRGEAGVFMHGPTFMANPLACAAANASLDLASESGYLENVLRIEKHFKERFAEIRQIKGVADTRVLGAIGVAEMRENVDVQKIQEMFVEKGVWIRPFGRLVYLMPPFVISDADLGRLTGALIDVLRLC